MNLEENEGGILLSVVTTIVVREDVGLGAAAHDVRREVAKTLRRMKLDGGKGGADMRKMARAA